jgi:hypothetical protein
MTKYRAKKTVVHGIQFDSRKEAAYYLLLRSREKAKEISDLMLQVKFPIVVNSVKIGFYRADFCYMEDNSPVVCDVKGMKTPVYRLKKKLIEALYPFKITEV